MSKRSGFYNSNSIGELTVNDEEFQCVVKLIKAKECKTIQPVIAVIVKVVIDLKHVIS